MGVANHWSIAWGVAKVLDLAGASIAFTCVSERFKEKLLEMIPTLKNPNLHKIYLCDVSSDSSIEEAFSSIKQDFREIDFLVHAIAFADKSAMNGRYSKVSRDAFLQAMDISCYSFTAVAREAETFMKGDGSMITMSYYGSEKWMPNYNVMGVAKAALESSVRYLAADFGERGIRVNAVSPGPIKTLSAMGIGRFDLIGTWNQENSLLQRLVTIEEVGKTSLYLLSDLSSGVTGEVIYVDCGYHAVGSKNTKFEE